ncbi:MAG: sialate O-acetylesterase [Bacteroidota bacterium]
MKKYLSLFLILSICLHSCQEKQDPASRYFKDKKVLILGNSITQAGHYVDYLSYILKKNYPEIETDIISIGLSSETLSCLTEPDHPFPRPCLKERLNRALSEVKPDVVFACYGMNDGIYHPQAEDRMLAFQSGINEMRNKVAALGAELVLISPPPFDQLPIRSRVVDKDAPEFGYKTPFEDYDQVLGEYANWLNSLEGEKLHVIDLHAEMNEAIVKKREKNSIFTYAQDGIHPNREGHLLMAQIISKALGLQTAKTDSVDEHAISSDKAFANISRNRDFWSSSWRNYIGYVRGDTVKSPSPRPLMVLMGGQSNMVGQGIPQAEESYPLYLSYFNYGQNGKGEIITDKFGPERSLKDELMSYKPVRHRQVFLLKYAIGGSSLLDWTPEYSKEKAKITGNERFGNMFETFFQYIDTIRKEYDPEIKALLWMQGERDARIPEAGKDYYVNFKKFIEEFRKRLGDENLPIIFARVNPPIERYPALEIVNEAQKRIANEMDAVYMIETEGLAKYKDEVHYNSEGQIELGKRFAVELLKHLE